ncbi:flagellar filament capping protein FliD [Paenibacillus sp. WQ 127069]|uniref:Flagellar hook-associated protein 2 n=2 Tax=Paenibacillus baimaensis TaxID=2982185 RepID=A0ABT2UE68_9BACL|nr:flagellar filament capping protein FliD [Paenibacillus sp. WQ 127069]
MSGLASGMDIDAMVKKMMSAERKPVDKMSQQKQILQWQRDDYREMNTKISTYRSDKLSSYRLEATFSVKKAEVSGSPDSISVTPTGNAEVGSTTIKVTSLATSASNSSASSIKVTDKTFDPSATLGSQDDNLLGNFTKTNGVYDKQTFKINGTEITIDPAVDSFNDVVKRINTKTNVTTLFDSVTGKISFSAKNTGLTNISTDGKVTNMDKIQFNDVKGDFLTNTLKVTTASGTAAQNAVFTINGLETTRDSNTFTVNGLKITLKSPTTGIGALVSVQTDVDKIVENVKSFITDYNEILKAVNVKNSEARYRDYTPLTSEQKTDMKEDDIKLWESKAKSGLLKNDTILTTASSNMRFDMSTPISNGSKYNSMASLGISTGAYTEQGKLYLDEEKLRAALAADPESVKNILTPVGDGTNKSTMGVAQRLYSDLNKTISSFKQKAGLPSAYDSSDQDTSLLGAQLNRINKEINAQNKNLTIIENRYYTQFSAMESAINKYNQQSSYISQNFGSGK